MAKRRCGNFKGSFGRRMPATLAAFCLAFALVLTGCGDDNGDDGTDSQPLGATLNLSGQVWHWVGGEFVQFTGTRTLTATPPGGTGAITDGRLSFTIGEPTGGLVSAGFLMEDYLGWEQASANPGNAMVAMLDLRTPTGSLSREIQSETGTPTSWSFLEEMVVYIFADRDVTISAPRTQNNETWGQELWTYDFMGFEILLREGWNALHWREEVRGVGTNVSVTYTLSAANPGHIRWWLEEWDGDSWNGNEVGNGALSEDLESSGRTLPGRFGARRSPRIRQ